MKACESGRVDIIILFNNFLTFLFAHNLSRLMFFKLHFNTKSSVVAVSDNDPRPSLFRDCGS